MNQTLTSKYKQERDDIINEKDLAMYKQFEYQSIPHP